MLRILTAFAIISLLSCTAGTTDKIDSEVEPVQDWPQKEQTGPFTERCHTFQSAPGGQAIIEDFVLYRDFLRDGDFEEAFYYWKRVYEKTPAADGRRWNVYTDGVRFYEWLLDSEDDEQQKVQYKENILTLYDDMAICYPEQLNFAKGLKAFDLYYKYRGLREDIEIYQLFKKSFDGFGDEAQPFIINPFTALLVQLFIDGEIDTLEARDYSLKILELVSEKEATEDNQNWGLVSTYAPQRLSDLERIRGFYPCDYYLNNYLPLYKDAPEDCETIQLVLSRLIWADCPESLDIISELKLAIDEHCIVPVTASTHVRDAYEALRGAKYSEAVSSFQKAITEEDDVEKKADYALVIAKIYYSHLRDFSKSREFALLATTFKPSWGEPHILIGKLYASSGPLCGPGRGWESQVVTWVAIDEWERARAKDSRVSAEANQLINQYTQYMPNREDIFIRSLNVGDTYFVPCWIQRNTTIRIRN